MAEDSFDELALHIQVGSESAFTAFAEREYDTAVRTAYHIVHSHAVAQEVVQDALLDFWNQRAAIDPARSLAGLLLTIVRRRAIKVWQQTSAETRRETLVVSESATSYVKSGENETIDRIAFDAACEELTPKVSLAMRLRYLDQLSFLEIGDAMGVSDKAAQRLVFRGLTYLRMRFQL